MSEGKDFDTPVSGHRTEHRSVVQAREVPSYGAALRAQLVISSNARGVLLCASARGESSTTADLVRPALTGRRSGILTIELLTAGERAADGRTLLLSTDLPFLTRRLAGVLEWTHAQPDIAHLPLAVCADGDTGGAALTLASARPDAIRTIVTRGGVADVAPSALRNVVIPTLLFVRQFNRSDAERADSLRREIRESGCVKVFEVRSAGSSQEATILPDWFDRYLFNTPRGGQGLSASEHAPSRLGLGGRLADSALAAWSH